MSIAVEFDFDPDEHIRASRAVLALSPLRWVNRAFVTLAVSLLLWRIYAGVAQDLSVGEMLIGIAPWAIIATVWLLLIPYLQFRAARNVARTDPSVRGKQIRRVDDDGYHSEGNGISFNIPWHAMPTVRETPEFFLFYYNKNCAYYLGKARLSAEQLASVRTLIARARAA